MISILQWLFGTAKFVPHGFCLLWRPDLVAIHVVSDSLIALSYFAIPGVIWWFVHRRTDLEPEHRRIARLFVAFITACGLTHVVAVITLWEPYYGIQALVKAWTAIVSVTTACALPFLAPKLLKIPSPKALQAANEQLTAEIAAHQKTLIALESAQARLQQQVADRDEDLRTVNRRFQTALRGSPVTLYEQDQSLRYTWVFNSPFADDPDLPGRTERDFTDAHSAEALQALKQEALNAGELREGEVQVALNRTGPAEWFAVRVQPFTLRDGSPGLIGSSTNIDAMKQQENHLRLVMRELNHRSKNLLTIVQSIARQTAVGLDIPAAFLERLGDRLKALASAHDVLVQGSWRGARVRAVVESQLSHQFQAGAARIRLSGEDFELPPEMAHYVGLAVHELGANAAKYGALSTEQGDVAVSWALAKDAAGRSRLRLDWREAGGPPVKRPQTRGFGRSILEVLTPRALGGEAVLDFGEDGVSWTLTAPFGQT